MTKRLVDFNEVTGLATYHSYDYATDTTVIYYESDAEPVLDLNKTLYNDGTNGYKTKAREWKHVANIPAGVLMKWLVEEGVDYTNRNHWPAIRRKLNSSEYLYLRTSSGQI